jgi:hypothetical protein
VRQARGDVQRKTRQESKAVVFIVTGGIDQSESNLITGLIALIKPERTIIVLIGLCCQ